MTKETSTKGERTRHEILKSAHQLFLKNGFHGTSMRQIAQGAGIAVGGIYNHFASKDEIFVALLADRHPIFDILPALSAAQGKDIESFVRDAAANVVKVVQGRPDFLNLMFIELVEFNGRNMPHLLDQVLPQVLPLINKFNKNKKVLRKMPPVTFFRVFLGLFFSYYITELMLVNTPMRWVQGNALEDFIEVFLHGVMQEGAHQREPRNTKGKTAKAVTTRKDSKGEI